jgi:magnesium-transporting ATPase (P-type)
MLTGDHPATARAIAAEAGLPVDGDAVLLGSEIADLDDHELERRLDRATVIARTTPLDKVRIVEALQRGGHVVAMTGDGVNDAPALRLADVGVAMGRRGTEVAREAADLVLSDDDFSTLAEALVEGRAFWQNMRQAIGLLLGGNAGEVGVMVGAGLTGLPSPLTTRQVLSVNLVTDVLPAVAVAVQEPEHRDLTKLRREGTAALDAPLRNDIVRRGVATALPTLAAYLLAARAWGPLPARTVAYTSVVTTQLGQTLDLGRAGGRLTPAVTRAAAGSLGVLAATLWIPALRALLGLAPLTLPGLAASGVASLGAIVLARGLPGGR